MVWGEREKDREVRERGEHAGFNVLSLYAAGSSKTNGPYDVLKVILILQEKKKEER